MFLCSRFAGDNVNVQSSCPSVSCIVFKHLFAATEEPNSGGSEQTVAGAVLIYLG